MKKSLLAAAFLSLFLTACPGPDQGTTEGTSDVINSEVIGDETSAPEGASETTPEAAATSETTPAPEAAATSETAATPEATASEAAKEEEKKAE